jgi:hypothetical protein
MVRFQFQEAWQASGCRGVIAHAAGVALLAVGAAAQATGGRGPQTPAETVTALYQLTEGARLRCRHAPPATATAYEQALSRFTQRHPGLIARLRQSPHHEQARLAFAHDAAYDPAKDSARSLEPECKVQTQLLEIMTDTDRGIATAQRYEALLAR